MIEIPKPKIKGYAIYNVATQKWSRGGMGPTWGKSPKFWDIGPLKNHLYQFVDFDYSWNRDIKTKTKTIIIRDNYKDSVIFDVETGQPSTDLSLYDILKAKASKEIQDSLNLGKYYDSVKLVDMTTGTTEVFK